MFADIVHTCRNYDQVLRWGTTTMGILPIKGGRRGWGNADLITRGVQAKGGNV